MQAYPNQDFRTLDGGLISDGDALTNQDDLPLELGEGVFVLSRAGVKCISTERLNRLNVSARANEQQVMTDIWSRIKNVLRTPFRMRKQKIAELIHDPVNLDQANPATKRSMDRCYRLLGIKQNQRF